MNDMDMVVPGELLGARREMKAGTGAYEEGESVCSAVFGRKDKRSNYVNVASVNGFYMPNEGDQVIAIVTDVDQTIWVTDIRAPSPAILRTGEAPWKVEFGNTSHFLTVGDTAVVRIKSYDEIGRIQITMAEQKLEEK
jgi:RNA-binding protein Rrp4 and related proteins (contain S1 domain and KH domain)